MNESSDYLEILILTKNHYLATINSDYGSNIYDSIDNDFVFFIFFF